MPERRKRSDLLNFQRPDDWEPPYIREQREAEERRLKEEEERRLNPDFSQVQGSFRAAPEEADPWGSLLNPDDGTLVRQSEGWRTAAEVGGRRSLGGLATISADINATPGWMGDLVRAEDELLKKYAPATQEAVQGFRDEILKWRDELMNPVATQQQFVQQRTAEIPTEAGRQFSETIGDIAGQPSMALSVFGGPLAAGVTGLDVYGQEYMDASRAGVDPELARQRATAMAGLEGGISAIPAGRFLNKIPGVNRLTKGIADDLLRSDLSKIASRTAMTGLGEASEEALTEAGQIGIDKAIAAYTDDANTRRFSEQNTVDFWNQVWRAARAGGAVGTTLGAGQSTFEIAKEAGQLAAEAKLGNQSTRNLLSLDRTKGEAVKRQRDEIMMEERERQRQANYKKMQEDMMWSDRQNELMGNPQERADQEEAMYRQQARDNAFGQGLPPITAEQITMERHQEQVAQMQKQKALEDLRRQQNRAIGEKVVQQEQNAVEKRAKAIRSAEFRKFQADLRTSTQDMDVNERTEYIGQKMTEWQEQNPLENFMQRAAQPPVVKKGVLKQTRAPKAETTVKQLQPTEDGSDIDVSKLRSVEDLKKELGMPSVSAGVSNPNAQATSEKALNTLVKNVGEGRVKAILKMIGDQKVVIIDDASELPPDRQWHPNGVAFYDGRRQYIIANRLKDDKNLLTTLVALTGHETKHAADLSNKVTNTPGQLGAFIGKAANDRIVSRLQEQAKDGNKIAQRVLDKAKRGSNGEDSFRLEVPAYLINEMYIMGRNDNSLMKGVNDVVSAVRTRYRALTGNKNIHKEDVRYLAEQLLQAAAKTPGQLTGNYNQAAPMIMGKSAPLFEKMKEAGLTYKSVDGKEKFVMSDRDAVLNDPTLNDWDTRLQNNEPVDLSDILEHDILYTQYPQMMDVKVHANNKYDAGNAAWDRVENTINISGLDAIPARREDLREILMHEIQHAVQDAEGHARGGNSSMFITAADNKLYEDHQRNLTQLDSLQKTITTREERTKNYGELTKKNQDLLGVISNQYLKDNITRLQYMAMMADTIMADPNVSDKGRAMARQILLSTESAKNLGTAINQRNAERDEQYKALLGEIEARMTQEGRNLRQEALQTNPEQPVGDEAGFDTPVDQALLHKEDMEDTGAWWVEDTKGNIVAPGNRERMGLSPQAAASGMLDFLTPHNRPTRAINDAIKMLGGQLKTFGNLGRELGEMKEDADGEAALHSHRAMNYFTWLNRGIDRMARQGVKAGRYDTKAEGVAKIKDMVNNKMQQIAALPDATRREAALAAFVRNNPELDGLREAVQEVNQLSRTLLKQLIQTNPDPTPEQLKLMNTIMDNSFRYTTQMYAAFQGPSGRIHSQRLIDEHDKAQRVLDKGGSIPNKLRDSFTTYKNAMNYLIKNDLHIPDRDILDGSSTEKLAMLYDTWVGDSTQLRKTAKAKALAQGLTNAQADQFVRSQMAAALEAKKPGVAQTDYEGKARDLINGMLELSNSGGPFASYYRGFKQDRSILEQRTGLPDEIKKLFGEITDPATRLAVTIAKQGELTARTRMLLDMRDNGIGKYVIPPEKAGLPGNEKFTAELKGENYGPLNGYRTTPEIAGAISDNLEMFSTLSDALAQSFQNSQPAIEAAARTGVAGVRKLAGWQKISSVVFDVYNMGTNFLGSWIAGMANGVINPKSYWDAGKTGMDVVIDSVYTKSGHLHPRMEDAIRYGVLDSARVQEIRKTPQRYVKELISAKPKALGMLGKGIGKVGTGAIETFAMSDAWVKIAAFEDRVKALKAFYKAEGEEKSDADIKREAANTIKDTNITYSRTPPLVRNLESVGFTTFMPYFVSVPRAIAYNYATGVKDLIRSTDAKTAKGKFLMIHNGLKRIAGASAATAGVVMLTKAIAAAVNGDDEDEIEQMKKLMYADARFADSIYLGKDSEKNPMFARLSRIDPFGPVNDFFRIAVDDSIPNDQKRGHMVDMFKDLLITNRFAASTAKLGIDLFIDEELKDKNTKLEKIGGATAERFKGLLESIPGMDHSDANSAIQLIDSFTPGFADMFDPKNRGVDDPKDKDAKLLGDMITYAGGRMDKADPGLAGYRVGQLVKEARDTGKDKLSKALSTGRSPEEIRDIFLDAAAKEHDAMREAAQVYEGMTKGLGYTPRQASAVLKDSANLTQSDIANIRNGRVNQELEEWLNAGTRLLSKDALKKREGQELTEAEQEQLKETRKEFLQQMKALGYKVRENNK